eukprot:CAMPEP_0206297584 /NCGR_PEP_ID=MMETSP0106_2-20121207/6248_1 /ASSEMBLY_ACC=CAM_ASM_000206 /TAXON_ID=81532 /ORGANISM="Acanthoeca-like sp., Strain 10tr" /LENGTH=60 /DNA_ID=CAMNT_0053728255 /DNA_START=168 /DNA_END=347 /DNA_ORIENTATION=+
MPFHPGPMGRGPRSLKEQIWDADKGLKTRSAAALERGIAAVLGAGPWQRRYVRAWRPHPR